eukprot:336-Heterocapsa_arctica.AAC.1
MGGRGRPWEGGVAHRRGARGRPWEGGRPWDGLWGSLGVFGSLWGSLGVFGSLWGSLAVFGGPLAVFGDLLVSLGSLGVFVSLWGARRLSSRARNL